MSMLAQTLSSQMSQTRSFQVMPSQLVQAAQASKATLIQGAAQAKQADVQLKQADMAQMAQAKAAQKGAATAKK